MTIFSQWEQSICAKKDVSSKKKGKSQAVSDEARPAAVLSEPDEKFLEFITLVKKIRLNVPTNFLSISQVCIIINDFSVWLDLSGQALGKHVAIMKTFIENYSVYKNTQNFFHEIADGVPLMFGGDYEFSLKIKNLLDEHCNLYAVFSRLSSLLLARFSLGEIERMNLSKASRNYEALVIHYVPNFSHLSTIHKNKYEKISYFFNDLYLRYIAGVLRHKFEYSKGQVDAIKAMLEYIYASQFDHAAPTPPPEPTVTDRVMRGASALFSVASGYVVSDHAEENRALAVDLIFAILKNPSKSFNDIVELAPEKFSIDSIKAKQGLLASHDVKPSRLVAAIESIKSWGASDLDVNFEELKLSLEDYFYDAAGVTLASPLSALAPDRDLVTNP